MQAFINKLQAQLETAKQNFLFRQVQAAPNGIDFCTNDYLGIIKDNLIHHWLQQNMDPKLLTHGNGASRLLGGNSALITQTENYIAQFHNAEAAMLFSNGYMANYALIATLAQKNDIILYDQLIHASLRAGIKASLANSYSFEHNNINDAVKKLSQIKCEGTIFIVSETVFSMDGDLANLDHLVQFANSCNGVLIIDEAHALGVIGNQGQGLVQHVNAINNVPIRIYTYGKAAGVHGAAIVANQTIINYLVNFCKPFIYSTAMANNQAAAILASYHVFPNCHAQRQQLQNNISHYKKVVGVAMPTAIQQIVVPGNQAVINKAAQLAQQGIGVLPVRYPTVAKGTERIRVILHSYNTTNQINNLAAIL
jgi:8-amino-7-oxononanoate synthase